MKAQHYTFTISSGAARKWAYRVAAGNVTDWHFHQTLTSGDKEFQTDPKEAIARLYKLLGWLRKSKYADCTGDWVLERQPERGGYHIQLILRFFGEQSQSPDTLHRFLRRDLYAQWASLHNKIEQGGNMLTKKDGVSVFGVERLEKSYGYLSKNLRIAAKGQSTEGTLRPFGHYNNCIHWANARPLTKAEKLEAFRILFPKRRAKRSKGKTLEYSYSIIASPVMVPALAVWEAAQNGGINLNLIKSASDTGAFSLVNRQKIASKPVPEAVEQYSGTPEDMIL